MNIPVSVLIIGTETEILERIISARSFIGSSEKRDVIIEGKNQILGYEDIDLLEKAVKDHALEHYLSRNYITKFNGNSEYEVVYSPIGYRPNGEVRKRHSSFKNRMKQALKRKV